MFIIVQLTLYTTLYRKLPTYLIIAPKILILFSIIFFLITGFSLRGFNECGQVHYGLYSLLYLLHLVYCIFASVSFRQSLSSLIDQEYEKMLHSSPTGGLYLEIIIDSSNEFYVNDSKSELKNSFLTSDAFNYPSSSVFARLHKYEQLMKNSSIFLPVVVAALLFKTFDIWIRGHSMARTGLSCSRVFEDSPFLVKVLLNLVSVSGDNLPFGFIYYKYVYLLRVGPPVLNNFRKSTTPRSTNTTCSGKIKPS